LVQKRFLREDFEKNPHCAKRSKITFAVYVKYQKQYEPIYFFLDLIYNEIMSKYRFGIKYLITAV